MRAQSPLGSRDSLHNTYGIKGRLGPRRGGREHSKFTIVDLKDMLRYGSGQPADHSERVPLLDYGLRLRGQGMQGETVDGAPSMSTDVVASSGTPRSAWRAAMTAR